jgi:hypothetical protein
VNYRESGEYGRGDGREAARRLVSWILRIAARVKRGLVRVGPEVPQIPRPARVEELTLSVRTILVCALAAVVLAAVAGFLLGWMLGPVVGIGLVAGATIGWQIATPIVISQLARALAGGSAAILAIFSVVCRTLLVGNPSDNAYLWIEVLGRLVMAPTVLFVLVPIVGHAGASRWLLRAAITLLWVIAVPGVALLLLGAALAVISTPSSMLDFRVPVSHVIGAALLAGTLYLAGYVWPRRMARG